MDESQHEFLTSLKQQIINEVAPLLEDSNLSAADKFAAYFAVAEATGTKQALETAFNAARSFENPADKSAALLDLLDLVATLEDGYTPDGEDTEFNQPENTQEAKE